MLPPLSEAALRGAIAAGGDGRAGQRAHGAVVEPGDHNCQMASALPGWLSAVDGYAGACWKANWPRW